MRKNVLSIIFAAMAVVAIAGNNSVNEVAETAKVSVVEITGKVLDPISGEAIAGASVTVNGKKVYTDLDGKFKVPVGSTSSCTVSVSMISYNTQTFEIQPVEGKDLEISLKK